MHRNEMTDKLWETLNADIPDESIVSEVDAKEQDEGLESRVHISNPDLYMSQIVFAVTKCNICKGGKCFSSKPEYQEHMKEVHNFQELCDFCGKLFKEKSCVVQHQKRVHKTKTMYKCTMCDFVDIAFIVVESHYTNEHIGKIFFIKGA